MQLGVLVLALPKEISDRLVKLVDSKLLPDIKRGHDRTIIKSKGILVEVYKCGVTRDQLPNLRALADYMGATYRKSHGNKVVVCNGAQLSEYFDIIDS